MNPDLDTLVCALCVRIDDLLAASPHWAPERPAVGIAPRLSDAELVALAVLQALLWSDSEARFIRWAKAHLGPWSLYVPQRSGYDKRLRRSGELMRHVIAAPARECPSRRDDARLVDSTPAQCGRGAQQRSELAGWAAYGYCASRSRWLRGLRLRLIAAPSGLPVAHALAGAGADERDVCPDMTARAQIARRGQILTADKGYRSAGSEAGLDAAGVALIRPAAKTEPPRPGRQFPRPLRQTIESVNWTLKSQLGLQRHQGRARPGAAARVLQRLLALTAAISHNQTTQQPRPARSLTAYDH